MEAEWERIARELDERGAAIVPGLLGSARARDLVDGYADDARYRKRIVMQNHGFGRGEYKYFAYPLPPEVARLRVALYPPLARIANRWSVSLGLDRRFPDDHAAFLDRCRDAGQSRPTPLILKYGPGDHNRLHQDLYGEHVFPLQATVLLSPAEDFDGGEFVLVEQSPRMQSRVEVIPLAQGDAVIFAVADRPVRGTRGTYRVKMRHGVGRVRAGERYALGIPFHDAT
ncbi:MAG TPA: 2OG-Fe(II) oxygenase [Candidatus Baltobacteraceae bacterium]|jgi:hypothetical protein